MKRTRLSPGVSQDSSAMLLDVNSNEDSTLSGKNVEDRALIRSIERYADSVRSREDGLNGSKKRIFSVSRRARESPSSPLRCAYDRCGIITGEYAKTFYLGTQLMPKEKARAIWPIYVWCRRTDELVDGPNASKITPRALDRWEERLEAIFEGRPYDSLDVTLTD